MDTERLSPRYSGIDTWDPSDVLDAMIDGQFSAVAAVRAARGAIERAALAIEAQLRDGGRLVYAGYSAGACVLSSTLRGLEIVDDAGAVVRIYGDVAVMTGTLHAHFPKAGPGETPVDFDAHALQVWAKQDGSWKDCQRRIRVDKFVMRKCKTESNGAVR